MDVIVREWPDKDPGWLMFWCPGCKMIHSVFTSLPVSGNDRPVWTWNESFEKPTFSPSILTHLGYGRKCHCFIKDGVIDYLPDCWHGLAGQQEPLDPVSVWNDERFGET